MPGALFSIFLQAKSCHKKLLGLKVTSMDLDYLQNFAKVTAPLAVQIRLTQSAKQLKLATSWYLRYKSVCFNSNKIITQTSLQ